MAIEPVSERTARTPEQIIAWFEDQEVNGPWRGAADEFFVRVRIDLPAMARRVQALEIEKAASEYLRGNAESERDKLAAENEELKLVLVSLQKLQLNRGVSYVALADDVERCTRVQLEQNNNHLVEQVKALHHENEGLTATAVERGEHIKKLAAQVEEQNQQIACLRKSRRQRGEALVELRRTEFSLRKELAEAKRSTHALAEDYIVDIVDWLGPDSTEWTEGAIKARKLLNPELIDKCKCSVCGWKGPIQDTAEAGVCPKCSGRTDLLLNPEPGGEGKDAK